MNRQYRRVPTRFEPDARFELGLFTAVPFRGARELELERLKGRLLRQALSETPDPELNAPLRRAANEAAGAAWLTAYPLLVFPALFQEKTWLAQRQQANQRRIRARSQQLLQVAA